MNRIMIMLAAVGMAFFIGACGQKEQPKAPEVTTPDATMEQQKQEEQAPAAAPKEDTSADSSMLDDDKGNKSASIDEALAKTADASDSTATATEGAASDDSADESSDEESNTENNTEGSSN